MSIEHLWINFIVLFYSRSFFFPSILKRDAIASRSEIHSWEQELVKTWEEVAEDEQVSPLSHSEMQLCPNIIDFLHLCTFSASFI